MTLFGEKKKKIERMKAIEVREKKKWNNEKHFTFTVHIIFYY